MRKINSIITVILILLFLDHALFGILDTFGMGKVFKPAALLMGILLIVHVIISTILTIRSEKVSITTKATYNKENREYWMRRWTGILVLIFFVDHVVMMIKSRQGSAKLASLKIPGKISFILFMASIASHLAINIRPLLISLGVRNRKAISIIMYVVYIGICVAAALACIITIVGGGK